MNVGHHLILHISAKRSKLNIGLHLIQYNCTKRSKLNPVEFERVSKNPFEFKRITKPVLHWTEPYLTRSILNGTLTKPVRFSNGALANPVKFQRVWGNHVEFFLSLFSFPIIFFPFLEEQRRRRRRRRKRREGKGKFPFLSKERPPGRVPWRSFENLKGGGTGVTFRLEPNFYGDMVTFPRLKMDTPPWGVLNYPQKKLEFLSKSFFSEVLPGITTISRQKTSNKRAPRKMGKKNLPLGWKQTPQGGVFWKIQEIPDTQGGVYFQPKAKLPFRQQKYIRAALLSGFAEFRLWKSAFCSRCWVEIIRQKRIIRRKTRDLSKITDSRCIS